MAIVSASQPISTLTPPSSSHGQTTWGYNVPVDSENVAVGDTKRTNSDFSPKVTTNNNRQPLAQQSNGTTKRKNTMDTSRPLRSPQSAESGQILNRKTSNISAKGVVDDFGDLYRTPVEPKPKPSNISVKSAPVDDFGDLYRTPVEPRPTTNNYNGAENKRKKPTLDPEEDDDNWIHRDKLAQIESRELEEAGFTVPRSTASRAASSRSSSRHRKEKFNEPQLESINGDDFNNDAYEAPPKDKRQRINSPNTVNAVEEQGANGIDTDYDPYREDMTTDNAARHGARPSTSRIPVKKTSPLPVPSTFQQRDAPLPRSRNGSGGWSGLQDDGSAGSQETDEPSTPPTLAPVDSTSSGLKSSPPKARIPTKATPTSGSRKASGPPSSVATRNVSSQQKSRNTSASSPTKARPGTSSGRPSTSLPRPEGDPPWITSMYKPDPRLPPDQQILPTHAKRMAQEQWEREGKTGSVYDKEFRLLNTEEFLKPERKSSLSNRLASKERLTVDTGDQDDDLPSWPLVPPGQRASAATSNGRPGTSGTDHGGYSIMPSLNSPKHPPGSPHQLHSPQIHSPKPIEVIKMRDPEEAGVRSEKKKEKGGCGCCIVM